MKQGELVFFCGKMGAGKSTRAVEIARNRNAVLISEDEWLQSLYPNKIKSLEDYIKYSGLLKSQVKKLVQAVLTAGGDVVMDFPANTVSQRAWFRAIFSKVNAPHEMVYLNTPEHVCLERIAKRRENRPERVNTDSVEMFEAVTRFFTAPTTSEGFNITEVVKDK
ncbi:cell division protein ZipA [Arenicella chitinivorans]|uniref:Cell division protein ZipA n=1 Tax=Arenicella chitinivorans TaxID=1329800 RepID=A0A918VHC2_9GAMM|nr:ATP-binding protein [Arenicella chitinivorans]GGZ96761.1 cell division protein ZipA [Arenicella chitinivorans]